MSILQRRRWSGHFTDDIVDSPSGYPPNTQFILIRGGNHTQFGSYGQGLQRGDNPATIDREEQQAQIVEGTLELLKVISAN